MPKISINEVSNVAASTTASTSGTPIAILGTAVKGPIDSPVLVNTYQEFISVFGDMAPDVSEYPYGYFAAKECLLLGNPVIFGRVANSGSCLRATLTSSAITVTPKYYGTYANGCSFQFKNISGNKYKISLIKNSKEIASGIFDTYPSSTVSVLTEEEIPEDLYIATLGDIDIYQAVTSNTTSGNITYTPANLTSLESVTLTLSGGSNGATFTKMATNDTNIPNIMLSVKNLVKELQDESVYSYQVISAPGICHIGTTPTSGDPEKIWMVLSDLCNGTNRCGLSLQNTDSRLFIMDSDPLSSNYTTILSDLGVDEDSLPQTAIFYPWYTGSIQNTVGTFELPPSVAYLKGFANSQKSGYPCTPVAGPGYGSITRIINTNEKLGRVLSDNILELGINPISYHRTLGYFIDGNCVYNPTTELKTHKQLSIRQTINYIKQRLNELCYSLSYGLNIPIIRTQFQGSAVELLDRMKTNNFIYGYSVALSNSEADLAEGRINATIKVFPTSALEEFVINLQVVNSSNSL